jgi:hypothetical protein
MDLVATGDIEVFSFVLDFLDLAIAWVEGDAVLNVPDC